MEMSPLKLQPKEHKASFLYIPSHPGDTVLPALEVPVSMVPTLVCCITGCPLLACLVLLEWWFIQPPSLSLISPLLGVQSPEVSIKCPLLSPST